MNNELIEAASPVRAMRQALEALRFGLHVGFDESSESQIKKGGKAFDQHNKAITTLRTAIEAAEKQEPFGYFQYSMSMDAWVQNRDSNKGVAFYTTPPAAPVHEPVITDDLPKGFIPLQRRNGQLVYAACMDFNARHYKWLMRKHPNGHWVSERKLEDWEVMQVEDQDHYGIIQEAEATPPAGEKK